MGQFFQSKYNASMEEILHSYWQEAVYSFPELKGKYEHSKRVAEYAVQLSGEQMYRSFGLLHDVGRIEQFRQIGSYNDNIVSHAELGCFLIRNDEKLKAFRDPLPLAIVQYHNTGKPLGLSETFCEIVQQITIADQLDNAFTCKDYLLQEYEQDAKGLKADGANAKHLSDYFRRQLFEGNIFVNKKYMQTYADYFWFAETLLFRILSDQKTAVLVRSSETLTAKVSETIAFFDGCWETLIEEKSVIHLIQKMEDKYRKREGQELLERLTWEQIQEKYPDQWIGLVDVKYINNDGISVESAVIKYTGKSKGELTRLAISGEVDAVYTTSDNVFHSGFLE